jgi:hypothetical protein
LIYQLNINSLKFESRKESIMFNEQYATRRASGYPGPGILPGEAQTFYLSIGAKF